MRELHCRDERRRHEVRVHPRLNGLDYVEVSDRHRLTVFFLDKAPAKLTKENIRVKARGRAPVNVARIEICRAATDYSDDCVKVWLDGPADLACYSLCIVVVDDQGREHPHPDFDPRYWCVEFSFAAGCRSDVDCLPLPCPPEAPAETDINYLAKDYASFRQLIFDRLALLVPDWRERHVPDVGVALVEVLAYVGDHLSYYQDAVATEAYLDTARQRISVRRHARLVDYSMHEGCNARAWVHVGLHDSDALELDAARVAFVTTVQAQPAESGALIAAEEFRRLPSSAYEWFEPISRAPVRLRRAHNEIRFYTWGDSECCLLKGATQATLVDEYADGEPPADDEYPPADKYPPEKDKYPPGKDKYPPAKDDYATPPKERPRRLELSAGDVLVFEEVLGPRTGNRADANPKARHAVRLTSVEPDVDPLNDQPIVHVRWSDADALPFPLCLSVIGPPPDCLPLEPVSVARGNIVLVDHGRSTAEWLGQVPAIEQAGPCGHPCEDLPAPPAGRFRPTLSRRPLTFREPLERDAPAARRLRQDPRNARPEIVVRTGTDESSIPGGPVWTPRPDLVASTGEDRHFVVEVENDRSARLRFGDGFLGGALPAGDYVHASYRFGCGQAGNVGAEVIKYIVTADRITGVRLDVRNPLPAQGGIEPETLDEVKVRAPFSFRRELQRAVTADDYARLVEREFADEVQRAAAELRWTGSWYEARVAIDPRQASASDRSLPHRVLRRLLRYRRIGHDLHVGIAVQVPLEIVLTVCVEPSFVAGHVRQALLERLGGFFHPDNLTFADSIFVSRLVAEARAVAGVENVVVTRLQRFGGPDEDALASGALTLGPFEIARLDNDPSAPEHGTLTVVMGGKR